ncbi:MAG: Eco29kI family restriction endonuclease, partial [Nitrososphaerales archaeon]
VAVGVQVAYVGKATHSLRERIGRYRQSLAGVPQLSPSMLYVALLVCSFGAAALYCERVVLDYLDPPLNRACRGMGNKDAGAQRRGQRCSAFDALFPGREWARQPTVLEQTRARVALLSRLARPDTDKPRWDPLVPLTSADGNAGARSAGPGLRLVRRDGSQWP